MQGVSALDLSRRQVIFPLPYHVIIVQIARRIKEQR